MENEINGSASKWINKFEDCGKVVANLELTKE